MPEIIVREESVRFRDTVRPAKRKIGFPHGALGSHRTWRDQWAGIHVPAPVIREINNVTASFAQSLG